MLARWVRLSSFQRPTWYNRKRAEHGIWSLASEDRFKAKLSRVEKPEGGGRIPRRGVCVSAEFVGYGDVPDPFRGVFTQIYTFVKIHQRALEICVCYLFLFLVAAPGPGCGHTPLMVMISSLFLLTIFVHVSVYVYKYI